MRSTTQRPRSLGDTVEAIAAGLRARGLDVKVNEHRRLVHNGAEVLDVFFTKGGGPGQKNSWYEGNMTIYTRGSYERTPTGGLSLVGGAEAALTPRSDTVALRIEGGQYDPAIDALLVFLAA